MIRASMVDGIFYPSEKSLLLILVEHLLSSSEIPAGRANAIIAPHAAYQYTGSLAADAFKAAAARKIDLIVLLGPVHREPVDAVMLPESLKFETPLGQISVNQEIIEELQTCSTKIYRNDISHLEEHCLEVQLPFIQHLFPNAQIVPVLLGEKNLQIIKILANALQITFADKLDSTLFIISANISSYMRQEPESDEIDRFIDRIKRQDWKGIIEDVDKGRNSSCGAGCIAAVLSLGNILGEKVEVLNKSNSADVTGDKEKVVHYAAIAISNVNEGLYELHTH